jgi:pimeloyl-ACP methyl ester carboxylesterase
VTSKETNLLTLSDGRTLCYAEYGAAAGYPVLYCHGFPASRLEAQLALSAAEKLNVRVIAVDRPGYGRSDFQAGRGIDDWPRDVEALMDALQIRRFSVLGVSGGGPYAMVCAALLHNRVDKLGVVCGLGQLHDPDVRRHMRKSINLLAGFAKTMPALAHIVYAYAVGPFMGRFPVAVLNFIAPMAGKADHEILRKSAARNTLICAVREAFRQGGRGAAWDFRLYTRPWPFSPRDIRVPTVIWHGGDDHTVPIFTGELHAGQIENAEFKVYPKEGHFSLPIVHVEQILRCLLPNRSG